MLQELQSRGHELQLEVLAMREDWIEIVTSAAESCVLMLRNCAVIANLPDLIAMELQENWQTLKHHVSRTAWNLTTGGSFHEQEVDEDRQETADSAHYIGHAARTSRLKRSPKEPDSDCREGVCSEGNPGDQLKASQEDEWFTYYVSISET